MMAQGNQRVDGWTRGHGEILEKDAYLGCHGAHIALLCEGEKGRGAARTAVELFACNRVEVVGR